MRNVRVATVAKGTKCEPTASTTEAVAWKVTKEPEGRVVLALRLWRSRFSVLLAFGTKALQTLDRE